jgi:hypothetical protein
MAVTSAQIVDFLVANPSMSDAQIVTAMETYGISPAQMAQAVGLDEGAIATRAAVTVPQGQTITLGDTIVQPVYQTTGSGMDQQVGGIENVITYKATDNKAGGAYTQYTPTGEVEKTGTQQEVKSGLKEFAIGTALLLGLPTLLNAGAAAATTFAGEALADAGLLSGGGGSLTAGLTVADIAALEAGLPTGLGSLTTGLTAAEIAAGEAALPSGGLLSTGGGSLTSGLTVADIAAAETGLTTGAGSLTDLSKVTDLSTATDLGKVTDLSTATDLGKVVETGLTTGLTTTQVADLVKTGLTTAQIANLFSTGATTAGGLLQSETARKAAVKAGAMIDTETAAAKAGAQFRPIGMTTRFGSSQFAVDPVTGRLTSAGYTLSPEAKAAQDRFVKLAESGLQQAEGAQVAFKPLLTGAESLFKLGAGYLAEKPETVAQNYLNQQMALLQPGRETELANLQTKLRNQGRIGLSVAQGGNLGATTPELQALYNARAQQEAQLAANAQQYGQQNVLFGAGLLGQGATAMGNYYGGQQQAYSPYTTAMGQVTGLESAAQQPFQMGVDLGKVGATTGFDIGRLGLQGAGQSVALATGPAATTNPYATLLSGFAANPAFADLVGSAFGSTPQASLTAGITPNRIAATEALYPSLYS